MRISGVGLNLIPHRVLFFQNRSFQREGEALRFDNFFFLNFLDTHGVVQMISHFFSSVRSLLFLLIYLTFWDFLVRKKIIDKNLDSTVFPVLIQIFRNILHLKISFIEKNLSGIITKKLEPTFSRKINLPKSSFHDFFH